MVRLAAPTPVRGPALLVAANDVIRALGIRHDRVRARLVFGSWARGDQRDGSDVDLILLTAVPCGFGNRVRGRYQRLEINGRRIDANLISVGEFHKVRYRIYWAYRLFQCRPVVGLTEPVSQEVIKLLSDWNEVIASPGERDRRIRLVSCDILRLAARLRRSTGPVGYATLLLLELTHLLPVLGLEVLGVIPFRSRHAGYDLYTMRSATQDGQVVARYREYIQALSKELPIAFEPRSPPFWDELRRLRRAYRKPIFEVSSRAPEFDHLPAARFLVTTLEGVFASSAVRGERLDLDPLVDSALRFLSATEQAMIRVRASDG